MKLSDDQLFLSVASIHSTSASTLSTLYDLLDRPECMDGILQEIRTIRAESKSSDWTKHDLDRLVKLDSFMKESQRYHPVGQGKFRCPTSLLHKPFKTNSGTCENK